MPTTINAQNALQIREKPMEVYISLQVGSTATITTYTASGQIKSNDSTLGNSSWPMRKLADLQDGGFLLDGTAQWYDSTITPSENNGKLGVRGDIGETVTVAISAGSTLTAITIASSGVDTITVGGDTYTATGNDVITINSSSATLVFTPAAADTRVEIDYIVPGIIFNITNDDLVSCTLALRSNLDVKDHTWEESDIEFSFYYPYDVSSSFAYVQNDWPITYQAGYDSDLSVTRKFYLSEPITQQDNLITVKGVDASHLLDAKTMSEQWLTAYTGNAHQTVYAKFIDAIQAAGITLQNKQSWSGPSSGTLRYSVLPEMSARDFVSGVMNLTLNHSQGGTDYGIQFVDAGVPTVEHGDGTTYGQTWTIYKSDCGEWSEHYDQNISTVQNTDTEHKYNESIGFGPTKYLYSELPNYRTVSKSERDNITPMTTNQFLEVDFDGYFIGGDSQIQNLSVISYTPSRGVYKAKNTSYWGPAIGGQYWLENQKVVQGSPAVISGGTNSFSNSNTLPGIKIEMSPFAYGAILDSNGETVFNYPSLFKRSLRTGSFTWKGDPRMQPLDYIKLVDDTRPISPATWYRVTSIELNHEGGGTTANIEAREWIRPASVPDYYVLADNVGDHIITNDSKEIEVLTEGE